jgi:hypothetical protein
VVLIGETVKCKLPDLPDGPDLPAYGDSSLSLQIRTHHIGFGTKNASIILSQEWHVSRQPYPEVSSLTASAEMSAVTRRRHIKVYELNSELFQKVSGVCRWCRMMIGVENDDAP